jgi:toxin ParE1/3/4
MQIVWSEEAVADLLRHARFGGPNNWNIAEDFADPIVESTELLLLLPDSGRSGSEPGTRELIPPKLPYILIYQVTGQQIEMLRAWHQREDQNPVSE